ncbi:hypothetical protein ACHAQH_009697 [Verticillium albo-atrum]
MGGSAFAVNATGESMAWSVCTNANAADNKSAYWFPWLYFHDPATGEFESVDIGYVNVYYFQNNNVVLKNELDEARAELQETAAAQEAMRYRLKKAASDLGKTQSSELGDTATL